MMLSTYTVSGISDSNFPGTLRYAITQIDLTGGSSNSIVFNLTPGKTTISPASPLPSITKQVSIEGSTQPGYSGTPLVEITGGLAGTGASGLTLAPGSSGSVIDALVIDDFAFSGIDIHSSNNSVTRSYIGTDVAGTAAKANGVGVEIEFNVSGNTIGGTSVGAGNVISGNVVNGVNIDNGTSCLVEGNLIGTDATGANAVPNGDSGIAVATSGVTIGGTSPAAANLISGNGTSGVNIQATSCLVEGNLIGTDETGATALANGNPGIYVGASGATIGGTSPGAGNLISGNALDGVDIEATSCLVEGNLIGTDRTGTTSVHNSQGVFVGASGATIGGTSAAAANLISGNASQGIGINAASCLVEGNLIGTDEGGGTGVPNLLGIYIYFGASGATIGGTSAAAANVVSSSSLDGIDIFGQSCLVEGNLIGTDTAGTTALPNSYDGIYVGRPGVTIGGTSVGRWQPHLGKRLLWRGHRGDVLPGHGQPDRHR